MRNDWQSTRADFNHDWLRNEFLQATGRLIRGLEGSVNEPSYIRQYAETTLREWAERIKVCDCLLQTVEQDMSPAVLFDQPPLNRVPKEDKVWMKQIIHEQWVMNSGVREVKKAAEEALADADRHQVELAQALVTSVRAHADAERCRKETCDDSPSTLAVAVEFYDACTALATAIGRFPSEPLPGRLVVQ